MPSADASSPPPHVRANGTSAWPSISATLAMVNVPHLVPIDVVQAITVP
ncbi:hypothetical protein [Nocardia sp. NPDC051463]